MNTAPVILVGLLRLAAALQFGIALLNLGLERILGWKDDLNRLPRLIREVFHVHAWFITITLTLFGVITWRFTAEMAAGLDPALRWLAAAIGTFWAIRTVIQVTYYSSSHWRGNGRRTFIHVLLLVIYGGFAGAYWWAAIVANK